jgi:hypothetical protein
MPFFAKRRAAGLKLVNCNGDPGGLTQHQRDTLSSQFAKSRASAHSFLAMTLSTSDAFAG